MAKKLFSAAFVTYRYALRAVPSREDSLEVESKLKKELKKKLKGVRILDLDFMRSARTHAGSLAIDLAFPYGQPVSEGDVWKQVAETLSGITFNLHDPAKVAEVLTGRHPLAMIESKAGEVFSSKQKTSASIAEESF